MLEKKEALAFSFTPFHLVTHKQPAQTGSQSVLLKETGLPEGPGRPPGNVRGNTRNLLAHPVSAQCGHSESHRGPCKLRVCLVLSPMDPFGSNQRHGHLLSRGCREMRVWHLAASTLPLKISKMSIVP